MSLNLPSLLSELDRMNGSDLHLASGQKPFARVLGDLHTLPADVVTESDMRKCLSQMVSSEQYSQFEKKGELDFRWELPGVSYYRVNFFKTLDGISAAMRTIPRTIPDIDSLGLPEHLKQLGLLDSGLVLVTGPTGSGKSTTMASIVNYANARRRDHILTIEDPIEFIYPKLNCLVSQREVGSHTGSFASALRVALREDPDIIIVGEMRDRETISLALEAAETGHLVFATLHTRSASETIDRIINTFPAEQQGQMRSTLSLSLQAVLSLALLKRADQKSRVLAMEILFANSAVRNLIRESKTEQIPNALQTGRSYGMRTMDDHLIELYSAGILTQDDVLHHARNLQATMNRLGIRR